MDEKKVGNRQWASPGHRGLRSVATWGLSVFATVLTFFLLLAFGASLAIPWMKEPGHWGGSWLLWAWGYVALVLLLALLLNKASRFEERNVIWGLIAISAAVKLAVAVWVPLFPLHADQGLFHLFAREMADSRFHPDVMRALSAYYDYPTWAGRVLPVHYLLRLWAGAGDVLWARMLNVAVSTGILAMVYAFACRLLPEGRRKWAVFLLMVLPFQTVIVTDYSHYLLPSLYFLMGLWCLWELAFGRAGLLRQLGLSVGAGICLFLMLLQRGVAMIALVVGVLLVVWAGMDGRGMRAWLRLALFALVIPLLIAQPPVRAYDSWVRRHDAHRLNSGLPGFIARGWCPESGGEYCARYEQLDQATPASEKTGAMLRLIGSQIRHNPRAVCLGFPVLKTAKLFLVGYASNLEESLLVHRADMLPFAQGWRRAAAPLFLGFAVWGCLMLARRPGIHGEWLPVVVAPLVTWGACVFFGETSPRYSIFCQPFLALLGALAIAPSPSAPADGQTVALPWKNVVLRAGFVVGVIAIPLGGLAGAARLMPSQYFYGDLEQGWTVSEGGRVEAGSLRPFEATLNMEAGVSSIRAEWLCADAKRRAGRLSFYLLNVSPEARKLDLVASVGGGKSVTLPLSAVALPHYVEVEGEASCEALQLELKSLDALTQPARVSLGYAGVRLAD